MSKFCLLVQVVPGSRESRVIDYVASENLLRVKLKARPEKGAANRALIETLGKFFGIAQTQITIKVGHKTRRKLICFEGIYGNQVQTLLAKKF